MILFPILHAGLPESLSHAFTRVLALMYITDQVCPGQRQFMGGMNPPHSLQLFGAFGEFIKSGGKGEACGAQKEQVGQEDRQTAICAWLHNPHQRQEALQRGSSRKCGRGGSAGEARAGGPAACSGKRRGECGEGVYRGEPWVTVCGARQERGKGKGKGSRRRCKEAGASEQGATARGAGEGARLGQCAARAAPGPPAETRSLQATRARPRLGGGRVRVAQHTTV